MKMIIKNKKTFKIKKKTLEKLLFMNLILAFCLINKIN